MPTIYEKAGTEVMEVVDKVLFLYHKDLIDNKVRLDVVMASNPDGDPVTHGGYPAHAKVKIIGLKDRAKGCGDAEIIIDNDWWQDATPEARDALIDHELYHLEPKLDRNNQPARDDLDRPKLTMRKHDYQMGWFNAIAQRHGEHSCEVYQATQLFDECGQTYFKWAMEKPAPVNARGVANYMAMAQ